MFVVVDHQDQKGVTKRDHERRNKARRRQKSSHDRDSSTLRRVDKLLLEESFQLLPSSSLWTTMKTASDTITPLVLPPYFPLVPSSVYLPSSPRTSQLLLSTYDHIREGRTLHPESGQVSQSFKHRPHPPRDWRPSKNSATHRPPLPWSTVKTRPSLASINYPDDYFLPGGSSRDLDKLAKRCAQRRHCSHADRNIANSVTFR